MIKGRELFSVTKGRGLCRVRRGENCDVTKWREQQNDQGLRTTRWPRAENCEGEAVVTRSSDLWLVTTNCTGPGLPRPHPHFTHLSAAVSSTFHRGELGTQKLKSHLVRTQELNRSPFKAWSRSAYGHTCYAYCQGFLPCLFLPFQSIQLHFSKTSPDFSCVCCG